MGGQIAAALQRWLKSLPKLPFLLAGIVIVVLGLWAQSAGGLAGLRNLSQAIVADLGLIQPLSFLGTYLQELSACDYRDGYANCSGWRFLNPLRIVGALLQTIGALWQDSAGPGRIILPLILIGSFPVAVGIVNYMRRLTSSAVNEFNLVHAVLAAALTPLIASLTALIFQVLAIVLLTIFGVVVGMILWFMSVFGGVLTVWKLARDAIGTGKKLQDATEAAARMIDPKNGDSNRSG